MRAQCSRGGLAVEGRAVNPKPVPHLVYHALPRVASSLAPATHVVRPNALALHARPRAASTQPDLHTDTDISSIVATSVYAQNTHEAG